MRTLLSSWSRAASGLALFASVALFAALLVWPAAAARACGCFALPDVATPLLQAGEELLFVVDNSQITMHVKIRYSGRAGDFGWLLPLPAIPVNSKGQPGFDVGTDEIFVQLETRTRPIYSLQYSESCEPAAAAQSGDGGGGGGCGAGPTLGAAPRMPIDRSVYPQGSISQPEDPVVKQDSVGPYDFAILAANDKSAMLNWLRTNNYVVPAGIDTVVDAYIRPGAYFLALRLRAGKSAGDLQPVVLSYPADLPMIPIVLTSVGATQNMGILVWVLGSARAIPRNYASVVVNDAKLDWLNWVPNYNDIVIQAVAEAPHKRAFVTEFSGSRDFMAGVLDTPDRFAVLQTVKNERDPVAFIEAILPRFAIEDGNLPGVPTIGRVLSGFARNGQLFGVLGAHVPMPQQLVTEGVSPLRYYDQLRSYLVTDRKQRPAAYADIEAKLATFNPALVTQELTDRIVTPTLREAALFSSGRLSTLTRLYTTLSPEDMTADPVFSFNPELGPQSNRHSATLDVSCYGGATLTTSSGFVQTYTEEELFFDRAYKPASAPSSQRIEKLLDTGMPEVLTDNTSLIKDSLGMGTRAQGCATTEPRRTGSPAPYLALCTAALLSLLLRRRRA